MTLDEAIQHCEEVAKENQRKADVLPYDQPLLDCVKCADEHRQLAEWLKLLKRILDSGDCNSCALLHSQCRYAPRLGEQVRYNCPFYGSIKKEGGEK